MSDPIRAAHALGLSMSDRPVLIVAGLGRCGMTALWIIPGLVELGLAITCAVLLIRGHKRPLEMALLTLTLAGYAALFLAWWLA